jgi:hypothetical protein
MNEEIKPPKKMMLVEDANAVIETTVTGKQVVVKVADRKEVAEKLNVDESQI